VICYLLFFDLVTKKLTFYNVKGKMYRLNWAAHGINERKSEIFTEYSVFVGDLSPQVTDYLLLQTFARKYQSVRSAKVVVDVNTGLSKRYGFVRFGNEEEMNRALSEMQGQLCGSRPIRLNHAIPRKQEPTTSSPPHNNNETIRSITPPLTENKIQIPDGDPFNTTVFIGGLDPSVSESDLLFHFAPYGEVVYIKIPVGKACGFVQFTSRSSAEAAFEKHGSIIGRQRVRLSWGRSSKQSTPSVDRSAPLSNLTSPNYSSVETASASIFQSSNFDFKHFLSTDFEEEDDVNDDQIDISLLLPSRLRNYLNTYEEDDENSSNQSNTSNRDQLFSSSLNENTLTMACNMGLPFSILTTPSIHTKNVR